MAAKATGILVLDNQLGKSLQVNRVLNMHTHVKLFILSRFLATFVLVWLLQLSKVQRYV